MNMDDKRKEISIAEMDRKIDVMILWMWDSFFKCDIKFINKTRLVRWDEITMNDKANGNINDKGG